MDKQNETAERVIRLRLSATEAEATELAEQIWDLVWGVFRDAVISISLEKEDQHG